MIDWAHVETVQTEAGDSTYEEVFMLLSHEMTDRLYAMSHRAANLSDFQFLKGAATQLGLREFANACLLAERAAEAGGFVALPPLRDLLAKSLGTMRDVLFPEPTDAPAQPELRYA